MQITINSLQQKTIRGKIVWEKDEKQKARLEELRATPPPLRKIPRLKNISPPFNTYSGYGPEDVAYDIRVEPPLTPLTGEELPSGSNIADDTRLDVAARGFWERCEMAFFDIRVFKPLRHDASEPEPECCFYQ